MPRPYAFLTHPLLAFMLPGLIAGCRSGSSTRSADLPLAEHGQTLHQHDARPTGSLRGFPTPEFETAFVSDDGYFGVSLWVEPTRVRIEAHERSPEDGNFYEWSCYGDTTYQVRAVCARHANEFYVYGVSPDGSQILERWDLDPWLSGAYYTERRVAEAPLGTPARAARTIVRYQGPFIEPALRQPPTLIRTTLPSPVTSSEVVEVEADPDGRFLLLRALDAQGQAILLRYIPSSGAQTVLADPTAHGQLASAAGMRFLDSTEEGRLLRVSLDAPYTLYLVDAENDGTFESAFELMAGAEHMQALPGFTITLYP